MKPYEVDEFCSLVLHLNSALASAHELVGEYSIRPGEPHIYVWVDTLSQMVEARKAIGGDWEAVENGDLPELERQVGMFRIVLMAYERASRTAEAF